MRDIVGVLTTAHRQTGYALRMDWGNSGARAIAPGCDVAVVIDVLSFSTTLTVAADRGVTVFPFPWRDDRAAAFAAGRNATLAVGRSEARPGQVSLSPSSVRASAILERLVLPSPNGSMISFQLADTVPQVLGVSLRNRRAAGQWLLAQRRSRPELRVAVIGSGERWPDGSLRPAVEDDWGAGGLIELLRVGGWPDISPEAHAAADAFRALGDGVGAALSVCASGRELIDLGHPDDVAVAAEIDASLSVPRLRDGAFVDAAIAVRGQPAASPRD